MIIGINMTMVATMAIKVYISEALTIRNDMTKAATAKAIPTP